MDLLQRYSWTGYILGKAFPRPYAFDLGNLYIRVFLVFEVMPPFFPFACFNGRRVLDWRRQSWAVLVLGTVLLWIAELYL